MSFFMRTTSQRFQGKFVWKKHVTVQERMDKTLKIIAMEAVDAWKKRVYHLVHIHVRAPGTGVSRMEIQQRQEADYATAG